MVSGKNDRQVERSNLIHKYLFFHMIWFLLRNKLLVVIKYTVYLVTSWIISLDHWCYDAFKACLNKAFRRYLHIKNKGIAHLKMFWVAAVCCTLPISSIYFLLSYICITHYEILITKQTRQTVFQRCDICTEGVFNNSWCVTRLEEWRSVSKSL